MRKKGASYLYNDQQIGFDYDDTVVYLLNPKNQELLVKLKTDLETRNPGMFNYLEKEEVKEDNKKTKKTSKK